MSAFGGKADIELIPIRRDLLFSASANGPMGYNARNDEIRDNVTRMRRQWESQRGALATVRHFNATLSAKGYVWFWPKIAAALTSKHHWLVINCDSYGTVVDWICE
jgi:hypothetical protein